MSEGNLISPEEAARRFLRGEITYEMLKLCEAERPPDWSALSKPIVDASHLRSQRDEALRQRDQLRAALRLAVTWLPIEKMVRDPDWREQLHTIRAALLLGRERAPAPPEGPAT